MPIDGYSKVQREVASGRELEARALVRTAMALNEAMNSQDGDQLYQAATINYRLWLFFYSEIESGNVTLPPEVASNIVSLAAYVVKVTPRAFAGERKVLETLISINRNIAGGLSTAAEDSAEIPSAPPPGGHSSLALQT